MENLPWTYGNKWKMLAEKQRYSRSNLQEFLIPKLIHTVYTFQHINTLISFKMYLHSIRMHSHNPRNFDSFSSSGVHDKAPSLQRALVHSEVRQLTKSSSLSKETYWTISALKRGDNGTTISLPRETFSSRVKKINYL